MPTKLIISLHDKSMVNSISHLQHELKGIRTGRASTGLIDHIRVDYYGSPTQITALATVSSPDAMTIAIKPFDPSSIKDIVKALTSSDLNLPVSPDGKVIRLKIPPLSEDRRKQMVVQVRHCGESAKVSIRNIRRDANKHLDDEQKSKLISEDDRDKAKKEIDDLTKKYTSQVEKAIKAKSEEIMNN